MRRPAHYCKHATQRRLRRVYVFFSSCFVYQHLPVPPPPPSLLQSGWPTDPPRPQLDFGYKNIIRVASPGAHAANSRAGTLQRPDTCLDDALPFWWGGTGSSPSDVDVLCSGRWESKPRLWGRSAARVLRGVAGGKGEGTTYWEGLRLEAV